MMLVHYRRDSARAVLRFAAMALVCLSAGAAGTDQNLVEAIRSGRWRAAESLIRGGNGINRAQPDGSTPLHWAAYEDSPGLVDALLKAGAKPNAADDYGETPLTLACENGDAGVIRQLLAAGADANAARWNGETALMIASRTGKPEAVAALIAAGANVNATERLKGQNALMWAAAEGHTE